MTEFRFPLTPPAPLSHPPSAPSQGEGGERQAPGVLLRLCLILLLALGPASGAPAAEEEIEIASFNGTYSGLDSGLEPIREGPLTIRLSSPEHRLVVHRNRLTLRRDYRGRLAAEVEIELEGEGRLVADVEGAGVENRFVDDVAAPRQTVTARGEVRLERAADGYRFTVERPGPAVALEIESAVAGQVVGVCRALALVPFLDLGCDRLERGLSVVRIPLPERGAVLLLPADRLTAEEREFFDRHAAAAAAE